jgi:hypothetical protein
MPARDTGSLWDWAVSFRKVYHDFKRGRADNSGLNRGLIRDRTPEEEKKNLEEYRVRMRNWAPSNGRK